MIVVYVACALFGIGLYGVLVRRDLVAILASIEVMLGGVFVLFAGLGAASPDPARMQGVVLLLLVIAAAEAAVGLALVVAVARRAKSTRIDELTEVRG